MNESTPATSQSEYGYDALFVERKWQAKWLTERTNRVDLDQPARPYFNLMMFPYPSAEGLHVGNVYAFTGADVHGRFRRLQGFDVFEPIGFDAFGIHAENHALQQGTHPGKQIPENVANFSRQLARMGFMFDWDRTVNTTDPEYYRWTQWIFLRLFEAGLAERRRAPVNWCPSCQTVLANEQVIDGCCERCSTGVVQRSLDQWFLKITDYAKRLLNNLDHIDWSESTKRLQRNWIGRSVGAEVSFAVEGTVEKTISVFTTRPETIFGATYLALAPEHPLVNDLIASAELTEAQAYVESRLAMDLVSRRSSSGAVERTGVPTGSTAVNPASGELIPIWIADYVLMDYGHGAVMGVPAHDGRDFAFAQNHGLEVVNVIEPTAEVEALTTIETPYEQKRAEDNLVNSGRFSGVTVGEASAAIVSWLQTQGSAEPSVSYRLHDWCISRQRYWGPPIPVVHCTTCGIVPVPDDELPVLLPDLADVAPDDSGVGPLARSAAFVEVDCYRCGGPARRETDVSDTFLDSSWYFLRYPSVDKSSVPFDPDRTKTWLPVSTYIGGEEHAVLHLMYARFLTMVLKDLGYLDFEEPVVRFRRHGMIVSDGSKMSKSRGNVINPDSYVDNQGADILRTYLMFMGPFQEGGDFREQGTKGIARFFSRLWDSVETARSKEGEAAGDPEIEKALHRTIKKVSEDIEGLRFNTAIAAMMNYLNMLRAGGRAASRWEIEPLVPMVAPFAPHLAEELWERLGHENSVFSSTAWPRYDPDQIHEAIVQIAIQINGKRRSIIDVQCDAPEVEVVEAAKQDNDFRRHLGDQEILKTIFVPNRIVNFVV